MYFDILHSFSTTRHAHACKISTITKYGETKPESQSWRWYRISVSSKILQWCQTMVQLGIAATKSYHGSLILLDQDEHFNDTRIPFQNFSTLVKRPDKTRPITFWFGIFWFPLQFPCSLPPLPIPPPKAFSTGLLSLSLQAFTSFIVSDNSNWHLFSA